MAQITSKELTAIEDLSSAEQVLAAKCRCLAESTGDAALKDLYRKMEQSHCHHMEELCTGLK